MEKTKKKTVTIAEGDIITFLSANREVLGCYAIIAEVVTRIDCKTLKPIVKA
jgi:hypothetical protein